MSSARKHEPQVQSPAPYKMKGQCWHEINTQRVDVSSVDDDTAADSL